MSIDNGVYIDLSVEGDTRNSPLFEIFGKIREADLLKGPLALAESIAPRLLIVSSDVVDVTYDAILKSFRAGDVVGIVGESVSGAIERLTSNLKANFVGFVHLFGLPQIGKVLISGASDYVELFSDVVRDRSSVIFVGETFGSSCEFGRELSEYLTMAHLLSRQFAEPIRSTGSDVISLPDLGKVRDSITELIGSAVGASQSSFQLIEEIDNYLREVGEQA
ncbi:MAG: hypothetical protein M0019_09985 [Actinomycetota bacterium]|nr:hypothetical protein [Actinomycetota bacterium]